VKNTLTAEETLQYIRLAQDGDSEARDKVVEDNMQLVHYVCNKQFPNRHRVYDDLVQVGMIGLIRAVDIFDTERGIAFSTYAFTAIASHMKNYLRKGGDDVVRLPALTHRVVQIIRRDDLFDKSAEELYGMLKDTVDRVQLHNVQNALHYLRYPVASLDKQLGDEEGDDSIKDFLIGDLNPSCWQEDIEVREVLEKALTSKQLEVVNAMIFEDLNNTEIGNKLGYSRGYVNYMLPKIREALSNYYKEGEKLMTNKKRTEKGVTGREPKGDVKQAKYLFKTTSLSPLEIRKETGVSAYIANNLETEIRGYNSPKKPEEPQKIEEPQRDAATKEKAEKLINTWNEKLSEVKEPVKITESNKVELSFSFNAAGNGVSKEEAIEKLKNLITILEHVEADTIYFKSVVSNKPAIGGK
jgi:RNA polymerase sporulation-specific sigma factor